MPRRRQNEIKSKTPDKKEQAERIHQVFLWIIQGATEHQVAQAIAEQWPDAKSQPLIVAAMNAIITSGEELDRTTIRGWCFESYRELYRRMTEAGDFAGAARVVKEIYALAAGGE